MRGASGHGGVALWRTCPLGVSHSSEGVSGRWTRFGRGSEHSSFKITSFGPLDSAVWLTTRYGGHGEAVVGLFHTPSVFWLASSLIGPTGTRTRVVGTSTPRLRQTAQNFSRNAPIFEGTASQSDEPPRMLPQHTGTSMRWRFLGAAVPALW